MKPPRDVEFERAAKKLRLKPSDGPVGRELTVMLASLMKPKKRRKKP